MSNDALEALDRMIEERNKAKDDEIDRLRAEVARLQQAIGLATTTVPDMVIDVNDPLGMMQRVCAEAELYHDANLDLTEENANLKHRVITDEQIDEAWEYAHENGGDFQAVCMITLDCIGIVECPACRGAKTMNELGSNEKQPCVRCHGHGWTREEHGDE